MAEPDRDSAREFTRQSGGERAQREPMRPFDGILRTLALIEVAK
jgi:hypothetical protein